MTTARKRWWRAVAIAAVGGGVIGGWFGLARPQSAKSDQNAQPETAWTRSTAPAPAAPTVAEEPRAPEVAPPTGPVTPASGALPIPVPTAGSPVVPAVPPPPSLPVPPPALPAIEPAAGPRVPDAGLVPQEKGALPVVPSLPPAELPPLPVPPKTPDVKPVAPAPDVTPKTPAVPIMPPMPPAPGGMTPAVPALPPLPGMTTEPPKAPVLPTVPLGPAPVSPVAPVVPILPQPAELAPSLPPVKPADPVQPMLPAKPDSDLKAGNPGNTLNPTPTVPPVAPAVPIVPPMGSGREAPGKVVDRPKPPDTVFEPTDKFVFPIPKTTLDPLAPHPRDDTMTKLTTTAALAFLGGAMLAAEKASALPIVPPSPVIPMPGAPVRYDDKMDLEKAKKDIEAANKKIEELERQVKKLTELLTGKREGGILVDPNAPGAVDDVKALKDKIAALEKELNTVKTQTALRPAIVPEAKPRGIVRIVNEYPVEITMMINEKGTHRVAPNTKLEVEVPAGEFTYQLLQSGAPATRSAIKDKETVTLRIK
jgi:hypothetical protein